MKLVRLFIFINTIGIILYPSSLHSEKALVSEDYYPDKIVVKLSFAEPLIQDLEVNGITYSRVSIPGLGQMGGENSPLIPVFRKYINYSADEISLSLKIKKQRRIKLDHPIFIPEEAEVQTGGLKQSSGAPEYPYPAENVVITSSGFYRDIPFSCLEIYPIGMQAPDEILFLEELELIIGIVSSPRGFAMVDEDCRVLDFRVSRKQRRQLGRQLPVVEDSLEFMAIRLSQDGIYRLTGKDLKKAGLRIKKIDPRTFQLFNQGQEVPIYIHGENDGVFNKKDYIEFYGERNRNRYSGSWYDPFTDENVYWLVWGKKRGLRYPVKSAWPSRDEQEVIFPRNFDCTYHFEMNTHFARMGYLDVDREFFYYDHWFFEPLLYGGGSQSWSFNLPSPDLSTDKPFHVRLRLQGIYYGEGEHQVQAFVNGRYVTEGRWSGQDEIILRDRTDSPLKNKYLDSENEITLYSVIGDPENRFDLIAFDYLEITYYRYFEASAGYLEFHRPTGNPDGIYQFRIDGFQDQAITIYKKNSYRLENFNVFQTPGRDGYSAVFQEEVIDDEDYIAADGNGILSPDTLYLDTLKNRLSYVSGCDYLIITADGFRQDLKPLVDLYQQKGWKVKVVPVSDIYNLYSHGVITPFAIKDMLRDAFQSWSHCPEYVLLVGDASAPGQSSGARISDLYYIPTMFVLAYKYGATASDYWYSLVAGDDLLPEFHLGRIPAANPLELQTYLSKRLQYEQTAKGIWQNKTLFIAGYDDAFKIQTDYLVAATLPENRFVDRLLVNPSSIASEYWGGTDSLVAKINRGVSFINFMGHGGGAIWGDRSLFSLEDVSRLDNQIYPIILSMTCFTGDFSIDNSLGEHLIEAESGGSVAFWGSTGLGWIINDFLLENGFFKRLDRKMTLGEAITGTRIDYLSSNNGFDYLKYTMVHQYNLMGDPALEIPQTDTTLQITLEPLLIDYPGEVTVTSRLPAASGEWKMVVYDSLRYPVYSYDGLVESQTFSFTFSLSDSLPDGVYSVVFYYFDPVISLSGNGNAFFSYRKSRVYYGTTLPKSPHFNEKFVIQCRSIEEVESLYVEVDTINCYQYLDQYGIRRVKAFDQDSGEFSLFMRREGSGKYVSDDSLSIGEPGKGFAYRFRWKERGQWSYSGKYFNRIRVLPDLYIQKVSQGGLSYPAIIVESGLSGEDTIGATIEGYFSINGDSSGKRIDRTFYPDSSYQLIFNMPEGIDDIQFQVKVNPVDDGIRELTAANNVTGFEERREVFPLLPGKGISMDANGNDTLQLDSLIWFTVEPSTVADSMVLRLTTTDTISTWQPDFLLLKWPGKECNGFCLHLSKNASVDGKLIVKESLFDTSSGVMVYRREGVRGFRLLSRDNAGTMGISKIHLPGYLAWARVDDEESPEIIVSVDDQDFFDDIYVSRDASFMVYLRDKNGVIPDASTVEIRVNQNQIPFGNCQLGTGKLSGREVQFSFQPVLSPGNNTLELIVRDAAGNSAVFQGSFQYEEQLRLIDYGNYPNPFQTRTWFVYELTQPVEEFRIEVYTVSGRRIITLNNRTQFLAADMNQAGYHEVMWDGKDRNFEFIANGVYYYRMIGKRGKKVVESKGVLAKIR